MMFLLQIVFGKKVAFSLAERETIQITRIFNVVFWESQNASTISVQSKTISTGEIRNSCLVNFGQFWSTLVNFGQFWSKHGFDQN